MSNIFGVSDNFKVKLIDKESGKVLQEMNGSLVDTQRVQAVDVVIAKTNNDFWIEDIRKNGDNASISFCHSASEALPLDADDMSFLIDTFPSIEFYEWKPVSIRLPKERVLELIRG